MATKQGGKAKDLRILGPISEAAGILAGKGALQDSSASVRLAAVWGLYHLAGQESINGLLSMVLDEDEEVRRRAVTCIGWPIRF